MSRVREERVVRIYARLRPELRCTAAVGATGLILVTERTVGARVAD